MGLRIVVQREISCEQVPCLKAFQWKPSERLPCLWAWREARGALRCLGLCGEALRSEPLGNCPRAECRRAGEAAVQGSDCLLERELRLGDMLGGIWREAALDKRHWEGVCLGQEIFLDKI